MRQQLTRRTVLSGGAALLTAACSPVKFVRADPAESPISLEAFDPNFGDVIPADAPAQLLGEGYWWAEGPAWDRDRQQLYFTDVPQNRAFQWREGSAVETFLDPSGAPADEAAGMREPGANGLLQSRDGSLLICNHGRRAVERMDLATGARTTLSSRFEGKRFNSPNDIAEGSDGALYFTDPPYGLEGLDASPMKEMSVNGVYRLTPSGTVTRLIDTMTFPNGASLSPDEKTLYVSQSDPASPQIRTLSLGADGTESTLWFDARPFMEGHEGLPDGMAVSTAGHIFLAGPGGVLVIDSEGNCLGRIGTGRASANCAFGGADGRTLFITAKDRLLAIRTNVTGTGRFTG